MRENVNSDMARLTEDFSVGVDPQRCRALNGDLSAPARKQSFEPEVAAVVSGREDPEEVHAVKVTGSEAPDPELVALYEFRYRRFSLLYPALKDTFSRI